MQIKLLTELAEEIAGLRASELLELLIGKKDVNEFLIAKKLNLTINQVRNIFYKLANFGLVRFTRKKDKRKGWYTYFWTLNSERALELLNKKLKKEIDFLTNQLKSRETKRFYSCNTCKTEVSEETALLHDFTCYECGEVYVLSEAEKKIRDLKNKIAKLGRQKSEVAEELEKVRVKGRKKIDRQERKEKKKKAEERVRKREEREKEKKKLESENLKKTKKKQKIKKKQKKKPKKKKIKKKAKTKKKK